MATALETTTAFANGFRLRMRSERTSVNVSANTSTVRVLVWIESNEYSSFQTMSSIHNMWVDGTRTLNGAPIVRSCGLSGKTLIMDAAKTVSHSDYGNKSFTAEANFRNDRVPLVSIAHTLDLDRIDQLPGAPSSAPTVTNNGLSVTATSSTASAWGGTITGYEIAWRPVGGSWDSITANGSRQATFTAPGGSVEVKSRARTARGWGPYSSTGTVSVGTTPDQISSIAMTAKSRALTGSWSAPGNGGLSISRYEVQFWDGRSWTPIESIGTARSYTVTDLLPGTGQKIRARAVNSLGPGSWRESASTIPTGCGCAT